MEQDVWQENSRIYKVYGKFRHYKIFCVNVENGIRKSPFFYYSPTLLKLGNYDRMKQGRA